MRLRHWQKSADDDVGPLAELRLWQAYLEPANAPDPAQTPAQRLIADAMTQLATVNPADYDLLKARFWHGDPHQKVAARLHISVGYLARKQRAAIARLAAIILRMEADILDQDYHRLTATFADLPAEGLFGLETSSAALAKRLKGDTTTREHAVVGLGGIGKTTLALMAAHHTLRTGSFTAAHFLKLEEAADHHLDPHQLWLISMHRLLEQLAPGTGNQPESVLQQTLRERLREKRLILIDNLEAIDHIDYLLAQLHALNSQSIILITSRAQPSPGHSAHVFVVRELAFEPAQALLRHLMREIGVPGHEQFTESDFRTLFDLTGGHPLALKLVAGLLLHLSPADVYRQLQHGRVGGMSALYQRVYQRLWEMLGENARLLLVTTLAATRTSASIQQLQELSDLSPVEFDTALLELQQRSLLESHGGLRQNKRRYSVHRLTETFIRSEVL